ncbi:MAG: M15 family metallopeptidase [Syntrophales bacterium]
MAGEGSLCRARRAGEVADGGVIVDSAMDFGEAVAGTTAPREILDALCLIAVRYRGFDARLHAGQLVIHRELAAEIREIFSLLEESDVPVGGAVPIVRYGWSDELSMAADNTSAFNYRFIAGTGRLSRHAAGRAVDINPFRNPALYPDGRVAPAGAVYRPGDPGTFAGGHPAVLAFRARGWRWGGDFDHMRDYHHFEK